MRLILHFICTAFSVSGTWSWIFRRLFDRWSLVLYFRFLFFVGPAFQATETTDPQLRARFQNSAKKTGGVILHVCKVQSTHWHVSRTICEWSRSDDLVTAFNTVPVKMSYGNGWTCVWHFPRIVASKNWLKANWFRQLHGAVSAK